MSQIKLIVGLGNPGAKYEHTRHNVGYDLLCELAAKYRINLANESKFFALTGRGNIEGQDVRLAFPTTFMNESGKAVAALCNFYRITSSEILVLHDEMDINVGALRIKFGGSNAGHNGLRSISAQLGNNNDYYRLRIGIGKSSRDATIGHVLSQPSRDEQELISASYQGALKAIEALLNADLEQAKKAISSFK